MPIHGVVRELFALSSPPHSLIVDRKSNIMRLGTKEVENRWEDVYAPGIFTSSPQDVNASS